MAWVYLASGSELGREPLADLISRAREVTYDTMRSHVGAATLKRLGESLGYDRRVGLTMKKDTDGVHYYSASLNHVPAYVVAGVSPAGVGFSHIFVQEHDVHRVMSGVKQCATPNGSVYAKLQRRLDFVGLDGSGRVRFESASDAINGAGWDAVRDVGLEPLRGYKASDRGSTFRMGLGMRSRSKLTTLPAAVEYIWSEMTDIDGNSLGVIVGTRVIEE